MPRPKKCRRICGMPGNRRFGPLEGTPQGEIIEMTVDEYEVIRLIDLLGRTQEECARQMGVARTTIQMIYDGARRKLARSLVEGRQLCIRGGEYLLCPLAGTCCRKNCERQGCQGQPCNKKCGGTDNEDCGDI